MTAPRLEIDLKKILHNATTLVSQLGARNISVIGITKAMLGAPELANTLIAAGVSGLGDSRIENIERIRQSGITAPITLIRSPMISQSKRVVTHADASLNTEIEVIRKLSEAAKNNGLNHRVILMVELGDLREGIMPGDLESVVRKTIQLPNITLSGIGTNLACRSGVCPDYRNMVELSRLADSIESKFDIHLDFVSGGNSANMNWVADEHHPTRINNLRLGESILLGREPLYRQPIEGLHTDGITLIAEVIETNVKPKQPWGQFAQNAFGTVSPIKDSVSASKQNILQSILAIGHQDTDPTGLQMPSGVKTLGASSDHLVIETGSVAFPPGTEVPMLPNYNGLVRAMTSPFVAKFWKAAEIPKHSTDAIKATGIAKGSNRSTTPII